MGLRDYTIADVLNRNAACFSGDTALVGEGVSWSYKQYAEDVNRLASAFKAMNLKKSDPVGIWAYNSYEYFLVLGAAAKTGLILLLINWRLQPDEVRVILEDVEPKAMIVGAEFTGALTDILKASPALSMPKIAIGGDRKEGFTPFDELMRSEPADPPDVDVSGDDPYVIVHTAAVGGRPRGAVLSQGNLIASNMQAMAVQGMGKDAVYINALPLFHIAGLQTALNVMHAGGVNIIADRFDAAQVARAVDEQGVNILGTFPPMLSMVLDEAEKAGSSLINLKAVVGLDGPDTIKRYQSLSGGCFYAGFGQTETSGFVTLIPFDEAPGSAGIEGPLAKVRVVDEYDRELPAEQPGEIVVQGPMVFLGYWNMPEETAYTFRGGMHHTGDIGRIGKNGVLWYVKRKAEKELIKPGGENVYPAEVEKALMEHSDVNEACVFGVPDPKWGEAIAAVCVKAEGSALTEDELIDFVAGRIARYKKPKRVTFVESLPKTEDGSTDREKVKADFT